jgi:formylglycine-generating enzyme required for sulfatase activity
LLEAGYLSKKNRGKTTRLIRAIADCPTEPEPFHNLVLAAECLRDAGPTRVEGDIAASLTKGLQTELEAPLPKENATWLTRLFGRMIGTAERRKAMVMRRIAASTALSRIESGAFGTESQYWSLPYGEPEWLTVPAGEFWMGSETYPSEKPLHRVIVPEFHIAPVTNAQYQLYVQANGATPPEHWEDGQPPKDKLAHPVVNVSWDDARQYCEWLSQVTGKTVRLPTEAEWEKAARGNKDQREYPWGDDFDVMKCNSFELDLRDTTPVGIFLGGKSPFGCLDMSGNVWEWVHDWYAEDYYRQGPGRDLRGPRSGESRAVRGGSWNNEPRNLRVSNRNRNDPGNRNDNLGFRCA